MTVCIAATAADSNALVLVADKSVSYLDGNNYTRQTFDVAFNKIRPLSVEGWAALIAGPMDFGELVIESTYKEIHKTKNWEYPKGVPNCMKTAYQQCRDFEIEDKILKPRLFSRQWYENKANSVESKKDDYFLAIEELVCDFNNSSSLLLCGFESDTPKIYIITNPGVLRSEMAAGFAVIGIGQDTALNRLYALETDPSDPLEKVLYDAFDAKEACSESLSDVGREWDAFIIVNKKKAIEVPERILTIIEKLYDSNKKSPFSKVTAPRPKQWRKALGEWSAEVLSQVETLGDRVE